MKDTFKYCRTKEAIKRLMDGDIIQNLNTNEYYRRLNGKTEVSTNCFYWELFDLPMEVFPPYVEWRSLSNLHYYDDLKRIDPNSTLFYLTDDEKIVDEFHEDAVKMRKRWFVGTIL